MTEDLKNNIVYTIADMVNNIKACQSTVSGREYALVVTKLEEASMWLNRGYYKEHPTEGEK